MDKNQEAWQKWFPVRSDPLPLDKWLQSVAGIIAALGAFLALLFVSINSAYVYFYQMLGTRPEDVGFDRLAILARTAGLMLPALILGAIVLAVYSIYPAKTRSKHAILIEVVAAILIVAGLSLLHFTTHLDPVLDVCVVTAAFLVFVVYLPCIAKFFTDKGPIKNYPLAAVFWGFAMVALLIGVRISLVTLVRPSIHRALDGEPVRFIELINFEAVPAHIKWLDRSKGVPPLLNDPSLLYLGHGPQGQVLLACGNIVIVPANLVSVEDGFHLPSTNPEKRKAFCNNRGNY